MENNNIFKALIVLIIITSVAVLGLTIYRNNTEKKAIETATTVVGELFGASADYIKKSNRVIVEKYLNDEKELYELTREVLPKLSIIGDYKVIDLLSVKAYYNEDKNDFQMYNIKFGNINKINWNEINDFDDFLNKINILD